MVAAGRTPVRLLAILTLALSMPAGMPGQSFRGEVVLRDEITTTSRAGTTLGVGQLAVIAVAPEALRFVESLVIEVTPPEAAPPTGSFSVGVFGSVDAPAETGVVNLAGVPLTTVPLGAGRSRIVVPFRDSLDVTPAAGSTRTGLADPNTGAVAVQLIPVAKGLSESAARAGYAVSITPNLRAVGALEITLSGDQSILPEAREILSVTLDGVPVDIDTVLERTPGIYRLEARAGDYLEYTSNVGIDQGRIHRMTLEAREPRATVRLSVPSVAEVFWNGEFMEQRESFTVAPGRHDVVIRLGDYSVSRRVSLEVNETYEVAINLDILLNRD